MIGSVEYSVKDLAAAYVLYARITNVGEWSWRLTVGSWLIRLAAWVMWVNVEIEVVN